MNAHSEDLRKKVINYIESGHSRQKSCDVFGLKSVTNWIKLKRETGGLKLR
ncbi:MAG: transposase [Holosporaceae bacterium]|jgi:transposase|nr:transposase [Holosporaceae bacterium]